jgi:hypothetical protein
VSWLIGKILPANQPETPTPIKVHWPTFTIGTLVSWPVFTLGFGAIWFLISHATAHAATIAPDEPGEVGGLSFIQSGALCIFAGMVFAIPVVLLVCRRAALRSGDRGESGIDFPWLHLFGALLIAYFLILFFYSGNFLNPRGVLGIFETFKTWTKTGVDSAGHGKPTYDLFSLVPHPLKHFGPLATVARLKLNWYWVALMATYEWFSVLGLIFSLRYLFGGNSPLRYLAIYGVAVLFAYSIIPYKTPWCIISIEWPFLFLGAAALVFLWDNLPGFTRFLSVLVGLFLFGHLAYKSYGLNFVHYDDPKELYAYVQTFRDYRKFVDPILQKLRQDPSAKAHLRGLILLESYFPIPWVIDEVRDIGYYSEGEDKWPKDLDADFIAVLDEDSGDVEDHLTQKYFTETFRLRDGMDPCKAFFKYDTFKNVFPGRQPDFDPATRPKE